LHASGLWRPRGDQQDVVVDFHTAGDCQDVCGSASDPSAPLIRLGAIGDYQGDLARIVEESTLVFDLRQARKSGDISER
jgi:hypothetical protein